MRLRNFLNEDRGTGISKEEAFDFIKTKCIDSAVNSVNHLYRGYERGPEYVLINPTTFSERESPGVVNKYYNLLLNNLPSWSKYPKRNKSIVASTSHSYANTNSDLYFVFPVAGAKMGMCPENDLWWSFGKSGILAIDSLNKILANVVGDRINNWHELKEALMQAKFDVIKDLDYAQNLFGKYACELVIQPDKETNTWFDLVENILEPDRNDFNLINVRKSYPLNREVWFDSLCVMIRGDKFNKFSKDFR